MDKFTKLIVMILAVFLVAAQIPAAYVNTALSEGTPHDISIETVSSVAGIECPEITGGTVAAYNSSSEQISSAAAGEEVVLRAYPEVEYVLSYVSSIPDVTLTRIDDIMYSFEMPDERVLECVDRQLMPNKGALLTIC